MKSLFIINLNNPYIKIPGLGKITSLSQFDETMEVRNFLATNIATLYIVDILIIPHLFSIGRLSDKSIPLHRGVQSLNIRQKHLASLADGGYKLLTSKINSLTARKTSCKFDLSPDLLESHKMEIETVFVGRSKMIQTLIGAFNPGILTA